MVTETTSTHSSSVFKPTITIRPARLWEATACGKIAAETYYDTGLTAYLSPYRAKYYSHYERGFVNRSWKRMLDARNLTFVAVSSSNPSVPVGYTQLIRVGDDEGAKLQIKSRKGMFLTLAGWMFWLYSLLLPFLVGKDKSQDAERQRAFEAEIAQSDEAHWEPEGRRNRWHVQSCVVKEEWQGKGIGKKLMAEVVARAERERVIVGLEASEPGELLYRSVGFELLARFKKAFGEENIENAGGFMMYTPTILRGKKV